MIEGSVYFHGFLRIIQCIYIAKDKPKKKGKKKRRREKYKKKKIPPEGFEPTAFVYIYSTYV